MTIETLHRSAGPRIQQLLNQQRRYLPPNPSTDKSATAAVGKYCDVLIQLRSESSTGDTLQATNANNRIISAAANFCVLAAHSTFIGDRFFLEGGVQFSIHKPLTIQLTGGAALCEECLRKAIDFVYDEPVELELGSGHAQHLRDLASTLGFEELRLAVENVLKLGDQTEVKKKEVEDNVVDGVGVLLQPPCELLPTPLVQRVTALEDIVLHFDEVPDKLQSRAGAFQYK